MNSASSFDVKVIVCRSAWLLWEFVEKSAGIPSHVFFVAELVNDFGVNLNSKFLLEEPLLAVLG
jgi:hypothetical protein